MEISICINPGCRQINADTELFCAHCQSELLIENQFRATKLFSGGGVYCDTYLVRDLEDRSDKILKLLKPKDLKLVELFEREYAALKAVNHPGIPKATAFFEFSAKAHDDPFLCLVMEKVQGMNLEDYLQQKGGPIDQVVAIKWMRQLVEIIQVIHAQNINHRDIKPANIMLRGNGQLALIDFGAAGIISKTTDAGLGTIVYTENYAAPEQLRGNAVPQSDYFSLGRTFVQLLTGKSFPALETEFLKSRARGGSQRFLWHTYTTDISQGLIDLVDWLMEDNVADRPADTSTILQRLSEVEIERQDENPFAWLAEPQSNLPPTEVDIPLPSSKLPPTQVTQSLTELSKAEGAQATQSNLGRSHRSVGFLLIALSLLGGAFYGMSQLWSREVKPTRASQSVGGVSQSVIPVNQCSTSQISEQSGSNLYGVIEIGSSGVKGEVVQKLESSTESGHSLVPREEDIEAQDVNPINSKAKVQTVDAVQSMFEEMQTRFLIPCEHIAIYGSSGFASKAEATYQRELVQAIASSTGRQVNLITPDQEATYVFNAVVPDHRRDQVLMMDVGSGNTKGAFVSGNEPDTVSIPWGTKSLTGRIDQGRGTQTFISALNGFKAEYLPDLRQEVRLKPVLGTKSRVYLSGGIVWALATLQRPCQPEQVISKKDELPSEFVRLQVEDFTTFYNNVTRDQAVLFNPDLSQCTPEQRERAEKDIATIRNKVFTVDELTAGIELLRIMSSTMDFAKKDAIFFSRYAFEALPIGYLKEQLQSPSNVNI